MGSAPPAQEAPSEALAVALLLVELARADFVVPPVERRRIRELLAARFSLDGEALDRLMIEAEQRSSEATSLYDYVKVLNAQLDAGGKRELMMLLWQVAYADGRLDKYEEHLLRKLADLLYVSSSDYVQAKLAVSGM